MDTPLDVARQNLTYFLGVETADIVRVLEAYHKFHDFLTAERQKTQKAGSRK